MSKHPVSACHSATLKWNKQLRAYECETCGVPDRGDRMGALDLKTKKAGA